MNLATLDFWGNRVDSLVPAGQIVAQPHLLASHLPQLAFLKVHTYSHAKPLLLFPRLAAIGDNALLHTLLTTSHLGPAASKGKEECRE